MYGSENTAEKYGLKRLSGSHFDDEARAAHADLLRTVLGLADLSQRGPWIPFSLFDLSCQCVGNVDVATIPLFQDGVKSTAAGIRSVAVDPAWRGRGLFRDLMSEALAWGDAQGATSTLLYTAEPALYEGFNFRSLPQHGFVGPAPAPSRGGLVRQLDLATASDRAVAHALLQHRTPVSFHCALEIDPGQFLANVTKDPELAVAYLASPDAMIVYEDDGEDFTLVDVVALEIPALATILGALGSSPRRIKTLFPPDRLGWNGTPVVEETGLMIRGTTPPAMTRPFMFPPTAEF